MKEKEVLFQELLALHPANYELAPILENIPSLRTRVAEIMLKNECCSIRNLIDILSYNLNSFLYTDDKEEEKKQLAREKELKEIAAKKLLENTSLEQELLCLIIKNVGGDLQKEAWQRIKDLKIETELLEEIYPYIDEAAKILLEQDGTEYIECIKNIVKYGKNKHLKERAWEKIKAINNYEDMVDILCDTEEESLAKEIWTILKGNQMAKSSLGKIFF